MNKEVEKQLRMIEASITLFRQMRLTSQALRQILIDSYNFLENEESEKKPIHNFNQIDITER